MSDVIDNFAYEHDFLSNFYPSTVEFEGDVYSTVEHAYQAAKTHDKNLRNRIRAAATPNQAKKLGRMIVRLRSGWDGMKYEIMLGLVRQKFQEPELREKLISTGNAKLVEGNWWNDTYWGVCRGVGQNKLGKILMRIRDEILKGA